MHERQNAAADALGRIFAGIGEGKRLLGADADTGNEAAGDQQRHGRHKRAEDGKHAEHQQIELVDESPAESVAKFTLAGGAKEHAEHGGAADGRDLSAGRKLGLQDVRNKRAEDGEVDDIEEVTGRDKRDHSAMQRRYRCLVQRIANESLYGLSLSHSVSPISIYGLCL